MIFERSPEDIPISLRNIFRSECILRLIFGYEQSRLISHGKLSFCFISVPSAYHFQLFCDAIRTAEKCKNLLRNLYIFLSWGLISSLIRHNFEASMLFARTRSLNYLVKAL